MTLERGTLLHKRYRIVEILGQGGMGSVYRAVDENLGVDVALKENLFTTDEYARQFRLEAVILANLRHPNLPRVSDHFVVGEQGQYLVMDYIEGEDLRQRMERLGTITEEDAILVGAAMCDALTYLHTRKPPILHRDLKPGNVKITPDGHIYLVDFGLAKVVQGSQATTTGARAMTPGYSPPEQYGTARTDPRTDIYSLGATLYAAMSGIIPEDGLARAMDNAQLTPLRKRNPKISRRLAQVIEKAMAIDPAERYQTAEEFKRALLGSKSKTQKLTGEYVVAPPPAEADGDETPSEKPQPRKAGPVNPPPPPDESLEEKVFKPPKKKRRKNGCVLPLLILLLLIAAGIVSWFYIPGFANQILTVWNSYVPSSLTATIAPVATDLPTQVQQPSAIPGLTSTPTFTPSAPTFTFTPEFTATPLNTPTPTATFTPSPTQQGGGNGQFAFASDRTGMPQIYIGNMADQSVQPLTKIAAGACEPTWSPDGQKIVFTSPCSGYDPDFQNSTLYIMNADGSNVEPLLNDPGGDFDPAWSPDGKYIAFVSVRQGRSRIFLFDVAADTVVSLANPPSDVEEMRYPSWSSYGNQITYTAKRYGVYQVWAMSDTGAGQVQVARSGQNYWDIHSVWSPDGSTIWYSQRNLQTIGGKYYLMNIRFADRGNEGTRQDFGRLPIVNVHFSPDGFWMIFESEEEDGNRDIFMATASGGSRTRLTTDPGADFDPAWRPITAP